MTTASPLFHPLRVRALLPDAEDALIITFDVPPELRSVFGFTQGQYLTLRATIDGEDLRRSYSICAGVDDSALRVGVRRVRDGRFSQWLHTRLRPGDTVQVMAPQGRFFIPTDPAAQRHYVGIAGGSGITPILSILRTVLNREPGSRFTLLYANRTQRSTMFREELEDLKNRYLGRLALHRIYSGEPAEYPLYEGRLDQARIAQFLQSVLPVAQIDHCFVCGPYQMNDDAEAALRAAGLPAGRIHIERFGVAPGSAADTAREVGAVEHDSAPGDAQQARITLVRDGTSRSFAFEREQPSVLDAATAAGLEVPFSCTSGVCGTCRARVLEGRVRMHRNFALDAREVEAGFVLTCQAHPLTPTVTLSFDER